MKISIFQKGGEKNHELIEKATRYFASKLMSTRMMNTLSLRIEVRSTTLPKNAIGVCTGKVNGSKSTKNFKIELQRDMPIGKQIETLAHEVVHVWQKASNTLQFRQWKSDGQVHIRWNGNEMGLTDDIKYIDRPWELEAFFLEKPLFQSFRAFHNGLTDVQSSLDSELKAKTRSVLNKREEENSMEY
jgi:hypothetical protein